MSYNNSINSGVTGILNATSSGSISGVSITQYNALVGGSANAITSVAPGSTSGVPLCSNGASSNPSFSTASVGGGGTGASSFTAYMPITAGTSSTSAFQSVATGTSNYVLQSGGSSALPSWVNTATLGGGNLVLIQKQTASTSSSLSFTTGITSTYNNYLMLFTNITCSNNTSQVLVQISTNGGSSYLSTGYLGGIISVGYNSASWGSNTTVTSGFYINKIAAGSLFMSSTAYLYNLTSGSNYLGCSAETVLGAAAALSIRVLSTSYDSTATVNALKVVPSAGTFSGTVTLYGILE